MYSNKIAQYYNQLIGDYPTIIATVQKLVAKYLPDNSSILEVACGTGNILKILPNTFDLHGLDNSEGMLSIASQEVPNAALYLSDMTSFSLNRKFHAVLCIFDSINHLQKFTEWEMLFKNAADHLHKGGIFIFDMNTSERLIALSNIDRTVTKLDETTIVTEKIDRLNSQLYSVHFQFFENIIHDEVTYCEETVYETTFNLDKVEKSLSKFFKVLKIVDPYRKSVSNKSGRVFFVCEKNN